MQLGLVIGDVVATRKDSLFEGIALLIVQPIAANGAPVGRALVAVDAVGAGVGEHVFFVRGKEASFPFHPVEVPADAGIVGIVDHWTAEGGAVSAPQPPRATSRRTRSAGRGQSAPPAGAEGA